MLVAPRFINYERPEGHEPGYPQVLVRQAVIKNFGEVAVDYESLAGLFEAMQKPADKATVMLYHSAKFGEGVLPKSLQHTPHLPFSDTYHVNTWERFAYADTVEGERKPRPANVIKLLADATLGSFGAVLLGVTVENQAALVRDHVQDISFPKFADYPFN